MSSPVMASVKEGYRVSAKSGVEMSSNSPSRLLFLEGGDSKNSLMPVDTSSQARSRASSQPYNSDIIGRKLKQIVTQPRPITPQRTAPVSTAQGRRRTENTLSEHSQLGHSEELETSMHGLPRNIVGLPPLGARQGTADSFSLSEHVSGTGHHRRNSSSNNNRSQRLEPLGGQTPTESFYKSKALNGSFQVKVKGKDSNNELLNRTTEAAFEGMALPVRTRDNTGDKQRRRPSLGKAQEFTVISELDSHRGSPGGEVHRKGKSREKSGYSGLVQGHKEDEDDEEEEEEEEKKMYGESEPQLNPNIKGMIDDFLARGNETGEEILRPNYELKGLIEKIKGR